MVDKYKKVLEEVLMNLRQIESSDPVDELIDDSIKIIVKVLNQEEYKEG